MIFCEGKAKTEIELYSSMYIKNAPHKKLKNYLFAFARTRTNFIQNLNSTEIMRRSSIGTSVIQTLNVLFKPEDRMSHDCIGE